MGEGFDCVQALVYTNVNDVIFHLRVEGDRFRFLHINPAFTRATGLGEAQVVGRYVDEVIPEPSRSLVLANYRKAIAERRTIRWEETTEYPTGIKYGEVSITPVIEPDGQCRQLVGTVSDVTEVRVQQQTIRLYADIVRAVNIGLTVWTVGNPDDVSSIRLVGSNPEACRLLETDLATKIDVPLLEIAPALRGRPLPGLITDVARDGRARELSVFRSVLAPVRRLAVKAFPLPGRVGVAMQDVTTEFRAAQLEAGERRALELVAANRPLRETLTAIVTMIEEIDPDLIASILLVDESGTRLRHGAAPRLPEAYNRAIDGSPISAFAGSCGTSAFRGEPVYVADIRTDPLWEEHRDLAMLIDARACWSTPIRGNDTRVLGTFALYKREPGLPEPVTLELVARATHITTLVLERCRLDEELRALPARIEAVREDERTGIAREIHDELGQALTALKMDIAWIGRRTRDSAELSGKLAEMSRMTDDLIQAVRRISAELRPGILDDLGLAAAVEWQADDFASRTGVTTKVDNTLGDVRLERSIATAAFRIFQEALTNIARHAAATNVDISLRAEQGNLVLEIADDGVGLSVPAQRSFGLIGMRERARRLGGDCVVSRREPRGTLVALTVPLPAPARRTDTDKPIGI